MKLRGGFSRREEWPHDVKLTGPECQSDFFISINVVVVYFRQALAAPHESPSEIRCIDVRFQMPAPDNDKSALSLHDTGNHPLLPPSYELEENGVEGRSRVKQSALDKAQTTPLTLRLSLLESNIGYTINGLFLSGENFVTKNVLLFSAYIFCQV